MIECRVLGTLDLRDTSDDRTVRSVLAQPKRTALLVYLAVATPRGPHRRDTLLGLLWPESDEERARNSLNQTVFKLRRSLGEEAIDTLGDGAVALGADVWCDAVAFEEALDAGAREQALELYEGELLPGFHLSGCREFERWLEQERARLRDRAVEATLALAREEEEEGNGVGAVHWLRRASAWAPYEEPVVRHLLELLDNLGDRAGAIREYRSFRERLERDLEVEPSPETEALVREIGQRARVEKGADEVPDEPPVGETPADEPADEDLTPEPASGATDADPSAEAPLSPAATNARAGPREPDSAAGTGRKGGARRWMAVAVLGLVTVALAAAAVQLLDLPGVPGSLLRGGGSGDEVAAGAETPWFEKQDAVLVADFQNRTSDRSLDGVLRPALARALTPSPFVSVASPRRIADALRLMRLPRDTPIDAETGRRVALRDPGIRAVLAGAIQEVEDRLVLNVELIAPEDGRVLASWSEEVGESPSDVPAGVREVALTIREYLGENLDRLREEGAEMERVTTSSLRALRLYDEAEAVIARYGMDATSEELIRDAIREDPDFASAHLLLAYAITNQQRPLEEALPHLEQAMELADGVSDRERYFIRGAYYRFMGDRERAEANWRALLRLHPDHYWANSNLAHMLGGTESIPFMVQKARYRPNDLDAAWDAAHALAIGGGRPGEARPYIDRVVELADVEIPPQQDYEAAWARLWDAHRSWVAGDLDRARSALDHWAGKLKQQGGSEARWARKLIVRGYRTLGLAERSAELLPLPEERLKRRFFRGLDSFLQDDPGGILRNFGGDGWDDRQWEDVLLEDALRSAALSRSGRTEEARKVLDGFRSHRRDATPDLAARADALDSLMTAELALAEGRPRESARSLESLLDRDWEHYGSAFFLATQVLASSYRELGRPRDAAAVLERAVAARDRSYPFGTELWMDTQLRLARLQRELGHTEEAERLEAELRDLTRLADAEFWLVQEMEPAEVTAQPSGSGRRPVPVNPVNPRGRTGINTFDEKRFR